MLANCRLACASLLTAFVAAGPVALAADDPAETLLCRLDVLLTVAPALSESARASMMNEAAAIWREQGVAIDWYASASVQPVAPNRLRVLVVQKGLVEKSADAIAVGELIRPPNGHAVAVISIESARHLLASVRGRAGYELIAVDQRRLGIVLGRALAHEIGHYLLDTHTHARSGLMRPHFNALEFTDLRDGVFALDHAAAAWLRARDVEKFAY
jgi:hypothetical protein